MSVEQFIDKIAGKGLLDEALLQRLRRDATAAGNQWNPQDVIKFLVEQGHLTRFQGKNLLKELQVSEPAAHESLELAASESIDGLSIGVVGDDDGLSLGPDTISQRRPVDQPERKPLERAQCVAHACADGVAHVRNVHGPAAVRERDGR